VFQQLTLLIFAYARWQHHETLTLTPTDYYFITEILTLVSTGRQSELPSFPSTTR